MDLPFPGWVVLGKGLTLSGPSFLLCQMGLRLVPARRKRASLFDVKPSARHVLRGEETEDQRGGAHGPEPLARKQGRRI